jgi:hypothetical protein
MRRRYPVVLRERFRSTTVEEVERLLGWYQNASSNLSCGLLHKIIFVAHSVAQIADKPAQNAPFRCSAGWRKLLICIRWGYYLANFKTAGFNRSPTPPVLILIHSVR